MKALRITIPPIFKSMTSLLVTAVAFGFTIYLTCRGKDLHASYTPPKSEMILTPHNDEDTQREILEREAEDLWIKQYGLDQANGGIWAPPKDLPRSPEEQNKIDDFVREVNACYAAHYHPSKPGEYNDL